ncbi:poly-gamma-glutamate biosynthesis protein PgsC/CapC, partial [Desulfobulbus sp. US4]|nr:poly-gamma-glutamate biosynthesis protein PgsC/CapC [Desulfobulbus sp. US4]
MTGPFILNIFPQGSLAGSVITPIWIGVCIVAWFNLRLGWVLSGLVVPGYLVPLLLIKPWAVCVILIEAVLTYLLVWFFSERLSKVFGFTNLFGRDRFFALLAVSVLVRLGVDTFLLPLLGEYLRTEWGILFDYRNDFHSFGLIITALIANQLWKPGLRTGTMNLVVTVGLTWLVVRFLLMEYTNFSVGSLAYMYENLAASMEAGPKAYIILLTTAYIASYYNLKYGWEYNGIVIPALLALVWYHPAKILVSVLETCIILVLAAAILRLPVFKKITMEGARKILLFFNICFIYKLLLGHLIVHYFPEQRVTDLYGFGYLLTTLMAIKMYDKGTFIRTTRVTLQVSFISLALASLIGFSMTLMPNFFVTLSAHNAPALPGLPAFPALFSSSQQRAKSITEVIRTDQVSLYRNLHRAISPLPAEMEQFSEALAALKNFRQTKESTALQQARQLLAGLNYGLERVGKQYLYLREQPPGRGWGIYALRLDPTQPLLIEVPAPLDEPGTAGAGAVLFEKFSASALAVAGTHKNAKNNDVLHSHQSMLHIFQKTFGKSALLQVRGASQGQTQQRQETLLWVRSKLPDPLNLTTLRSLTGPFNLRWGTRAQGNLLREDTEARFAELVLSGGGKRALLAGSIFSGEGVISREGELALRGYLQEQLRKSKLESAAKKTKPSPGPLLEELLFFDREVLTPLVRLVRTWPENNELTGPTGLTGLTGFAMHKDALDNIADAAAVLGYELVHYRHTISGQEYFLLAEPTGQEKRHWGSVVFRLGQGSD